MTFNHPKFVEQCNHIKAYLFLST